MNMGAVKALIDSGVQCPQPDNPDDMIIGTWLSSLGIQIVHSPLFHQVYFLLLVRIVILAHPIDTPPPLNSPSWIHLPPIITPIHGYTSPIDFTTYRHLLVHIHQDC